MLLGGATVLRFRMLAVAAVAVAGTLLAGGTVPVQPAIAAGARAPGPAIGGGVVLAGVSCTSVSFCVAVGSHQTAAGRSWAGLSELWNGQRWVTEAVPGRPQRGLVTSPGEVACGGPASCVLVGDHYQVAAAPSMVAESGGGATWSITQWTDPHGAKMGWLGDVSCAGPSFCMAVGADSASGFAAEHAFAELWAGRSWLRLSPPGPARARWSELGGLSCVSATDCVAVGGYQNSARRVLGFADTWNGHGWALAATPSAPGARQTIFNAVSCASATTCMAVGYGAGPGERQLAERLSGGRWRLTSLPRSGSSLLGGVSCPAITLCVATGRAGHAALGELWDAGAWRALRMPRLTGTRTWAELSHVSCVAAAHCVAVGFRFDPKARDSDRSLAEVWDGHGWRIQATVNPS